METLDIAAIWAVIIALSIYLYVILDGFDIGIGLLFPWLRAEKDRNVAMHSVAPVWDGNETWLVMAAAGLLAAFPKAFVLLMPAFYLPLTAMLAALVLRGVAVELRPKASPGFRVFWNRCFAIGSLVVAVTQGLIVGRYLEGVTTAGTVYTGNWFGWLTPFSVFMAVGVTAGYALLGATWLIMKGSDDLADRARNWTRHLTPVVFAFIVIVSICVIVFNVEAGRRWGIVWPIINLKALLPLLPIPVAVGLLAVWMARALRRKSEVLPFLCAAGLFSMGFLGLAISLFPYAVPYRMTIWQAAAASNAQAILLVGVLVLLPLILTYTGYVYWVFRGKAEKTELFTEPGLGRNAVP